MSQSNEMRVLYLDIETAPALAYIWDLKTRYVPISQVAEDGYILCFAAAWENDDEIEFRSLWNDGHDAMIKRAWELLDEADAVIHYNGNKFDIPRLNTEFLISRLGPPSPSHQIDLFQTVNNKFKVLSKSMNHMLWLLGLESKMAHKGQALWTGCMHGDKGDQQVMTDYNIQDVEVMEDLYMELRPWIANHPNRALWMEPGAEPICPICSSKNLRFKSYKRTQVLPYKQYHCQDCGCYPRERFADKAARGRRDVLRT